MKRPAKIILDICKKDKFVRDLWLRTIDRNTIPGKLKLQYVLEYFVEYHRLYPELSIIEVDDIYEDSVMLHHMLIDLNDREPFSAEADVILLDEILRDYSVNIIELLDLSKGYHLRGNISNFAQSKVNPGRFAI